MLRNALEHRGGGDWKLTKFWEIVKIMKKMHTNLPPPKECDVDCEQTLSPNRFQLISEKVFQSFLYNFPINEETKVSD